MRSVRLGSMRRRSGVEMCWRFLRRRKPRLSSFVCFLRVAAMRVPTLAPRSRRRTAAGRRAQWNHAEGRVAMRLMACFQEVLRHGGGQLTRLGAALSQALDELDAPAPASRSDEARVRTRVVCGRGEVRDASVWTRSRRRVMTWQGATSGSLKSQGGVAAAWKLFQELWDSRGEVHKSIENYAVFRGRLLRDGHRAREGTARGCC